MELKEIKPKAIAMLKAGTSIEEIAKHFNIAPVIVEEWKDNFTDDNKISMEIQTYATREILEKIETSNIPNKEKLQLSLETSAIKLTNMLLPGAGDYEVASALNKTANSIAVLQKAFFPIPNVAIQNNNTNTTEISGDLKFKDILKD